MKISKKVLAGLVIAVAAGTGFVYANNGSGRTSVEFFSGHTHEGHETHGAPSHSGGLDRNGCHNGSVPYHCH
jgi:hypothetical protein